MGTRASSRRASLLKPPAETRSPLSAGFCRPGHALRCCALSALNSPSIAQAVGTRNDVRLDRAHDTDPKVGVAGDDPVAEDRVADEARDLSRGVLNRHRTVSGKGVHTYRVSPTRIGVRAGNVCVGPPDDQTLQMMNASRRARFHSARRVHTRLRIVPGCHSLARRSVSSAKKPSSSTSPMNVAFGARSVTRHQSATVMPRVRAEPVSISTLIWRPENRSGASR